jgi:hypothetical protein
MAYYGGGHNPLFGRDAGPPPPPGAGRGAAYGAPQQQQVWGQYPGYQPSRPYSYSYPQLQYGIPTTPAYPTPGYPQSWAPASNATGTAMTLGSRPFQPAPAIDPALPAGNMTNSTGGVGCEPGYNYFFPAEHCKMIVLKTGSTPPWQLPPNFSVGFSAMHVPCNTTLGELLKGFGATNSVPKRNRVTEVVQGGNGRWYRGMGFSGDDEADCRRPIREFGWDRTRTGLAGQKPVVYLYIQRD